MIKEESVYKIGRLGKPHGVKGEISMQVDDDIFDRVGAEYLVLLLDGIMVPFFMEGCRFKSDGMALIKFEGINTSDRARHFTGTEVYFPRELAEADSDDGLSYAQLVGYTLVNAKDGKSVGVVDFVDEQTMNIMFELKDGTLIPASEALIVDIDAENQIITMDIPEGILEMND